MTTPKHVSSTIKAEHIETLRKMAEQLSKNAENAERMCELLQPEFDKFEARAEPHNVYVVRDYVDHRNAAKRQRKEAEAILAAIQPDPEPQPVAWLWLSTHGRVRSASNDPPDQGHLDTAQVDGDRIIPVHTTPSSAGTVSVEKAAKVLLDACPNPIFDTLKPALMGEVTEREAYIDEDGNEAYYDKPVSWDAMKKTIRAALRALAGDNQ